MRLKFLGATGTVTGSKYLLIIDNQKILVDCGLFQGQKELRLRNWNPLPISPSNLDKIVLTHAHIDHSGFLPLLVKNGFTGPIYATQATCDLCAILLPDSGFLQEEEAKRANQYGYSKHHPALPLYSKADAERSLEQFKPVEFGKAYWFGNETTFTWHHAGHILGSAFIQVQTGQQRILFSGDLGRPHDPVMRSPAIMQNTDYLILESTYGDRLHDKADPIEQIKTIVNETYARHGTLVIPAFAVGRAQALLYYLYQLKTLKLIPDLPIYLDSPMAIDATQLLLSYPTEHQLPPSMCVKVCHTAIYTNTQEQSKAIIENEHSKIIISASGMATGGRILHHLKAYAPDPRNTILFTGFQAAGTRGARILAGESTIKIHGEMVPVRAQIKYLTNTSAHADYAETLLWLRQFNHPPRKIFITHGEPAAALALKEHIETELKIPCVIPNYLDEVSL
ncbi:MAG: mRNA 3'-end processing factor [Gammaproteobacteria bacterium RIFCSPHIGHO2_12_FULL_35_23]|nr:MAG: mRNA 3'-end processing factor [Gammaproteobacteria bacterium RIFCSPHIGHO2_12_FULL_35_23]